MSRKFKCQRREVPNGKLTEPQVTHHMCDLTGGCPRGIYSWMATSYRHSQMNQIGRVNFSSYMPVGHSPFSFNSYRGVFPNKQILRDYAENCAILRPSAITNQASDLVLGYRLSPEPQTGWRRFL